MPSLSSPVVLVVVKAPRAGFVKTRLAAEVGAAEALRIYRLLVERQMAALPAGWAVEVHFAPGDGREEMRAWLGAGPAFHAQGEGDLGARLTLAVAGAFARGAGGVLVIGGDCPELDADTLRAAAAALETHGLVLGPANDGGYYLIGLARPLPLLFEAVPWSGPEVLAVTLRRAQEAGLTPALLTHKDDVDTLADWRRYSTGLTGGA